MRQDGKNQGEAAQTLLSVLKRCRDKWFRFVLRMVQNPADAEDVLQEGFCRVLACRKLFQNEEQARMYLARTISNTAIETYHARIRERRIHLPAHDHQLPDHQRFTPQMLLESKEDADKNSRLMGLLEHALSRLPPKQYEALRMTVMDGSGYSIRDVGELNGIAYSTLRHRRNQGLRRMRRYLSRALRAKRNAKSLKTL